MQVEDHQRGCCDDDTVNAVFFPFLCSLCAGDDQEEDLRLESTEIKTKMKTKIKTKIKAEITQQQQRSSKSAKRRQQAVAFAATHTKISVSCLLLLSSFAATHTHKKFCVSSLLAVVVLFSFVCCLPVANVHKGTCKSLTHTHNLCQMYVYNVSYLYCKYVHILLY